MTGIYKLNGSLQHYIWGGKDYLPNFLGQPKTEAHYAEWWLGAHPSAPSMIEVNGTQQPLTQFLSQNPTALGQSSRARFGDELPYLLKILDVEKPLSIQLHPTKQQAEIGFARENAAFVDLKDPKRTYKDRNHKPEMMIALSDFWLLHGFKPKAQIIATLQQRPSLNGLAEKLQQQDLHSFYSQIMQADQAQLASWLLPIIAEHKVRYKNNQFSLDNPDYWVLYCMETMEISEDKLDAGLVCFYLFNIVQVKQGEGIYQDAGIPHAYLRGQNIELMACSDNVIRGGLTPKHVDIPELLKVVDCREIIPQIIPAADEQNAIMTYETPAEDFALSNLRYQAQNQLDLHAQSAEILLVMEGSLKIRQNQTALELKQGESAFICAGCDYQIEGNQRGYAVIAKLP